jgi:hypothetical protein
MPRSGPTISHAYWGCCGSSHSNHSGSSDNEVNQSQRPRPGLRQSQRRVRLQRFAACGLTSRSGPEKPHAFAGPPRQAQTVCEPYPEDDFRQLVVPVETTPASFRSLRDLKDHGERGLVRETPLSSARCGAKLMTEISLVITVWTI